MDAQPITPQQEQIVRDLRTNSVFSDLPEENLAWLAERMEDIRIGPGGTFGRKGDPLEYLNVLLEGEIQV